MGRLKTPARSIVITAQLRGRTRCKAGFAIFLRHWRKLTDRTLAVNFQLCPMQTDIQSRRRVVRNLAKRVADKALPAAPNGSCSACAAAHHRPARLLVGLVVLIFPGGAAAVTAVTGDGDQRMLLVAVPVLPAVFLPVIALHQLSMAGRTPPVALNASTRLAELHFFKFLLAVGVLGHGMKSRSRTTIVAARR